MVNQSLLAEVTALPLEDRRELVNVLIETFDDDQFPCELDEAVEGLRLYRENPAAVQPWDEAMAELRREA
ncbi:MAG: hypothetical protein LBK95_19660 [Bifidobacteriaceae bacterium]|jgi:hypothetical protein|nr:hypothetical protein [Bifidobacteriaceae bacterium]